MEPETMNLDIPVRVETEEGIHEAWHSLSEEDLRRPAMAGSGVMLIPAAEIDRRSRDWTTKPVDPPWRVLSTPNFSIRSDREGERIREIGVYLEEFNLMLRGTINGRPQEAPFMLRLFSDQRDFCVYATLCQAANALSFYDPRSGEMVMWTHEAMEMEKFQRLMAHEFTHAFMDKMWRRTEPPWFAEGMAAYFSTFEWREGGLVPGGVLPALLDLLRAGPLVPLDRFTRFGRGDMYSSSAWPLLYAQAWSVVHFLFAREPDIITALLEGRWTPFPGGFEAPWRAHVEGLTGSRTDWA
jgi:hypothetical protein